MFLSEHAPLKATQNPSRRIDATNNLWIEPYFPINESTYPTFGKRRFSTAVICGRGGKNIARLMQINKVYFLFPRSTCSNQLCEYCKFYRIFYIDWNKNKVKAIKVYQEPKNFEKQNIFQVN